METKESNFYNTSWSNESWDEMIDNTPAPKHRRRIISKIIKNLKCEKKSFLDVGCGNGSLIKLLSNQYTDSKFSGLDISESVISRNRKKYTDVDWDTLDLDEANLVNKADVVISSEVIEHVRDWKLSLNKLIKSANNYVIISVPSGKIYPIDKKVGHYQHFNSKLVNDHLSTIEGISWDIKYWGFPFHMLYKFLININANKTYKSYAQKKKYSFFESILSRLINILFYFNVFSSFETSQMFIVIKKSDEKKR